MEDEEEQEDDDFMASPPRAKRSPPVRRSARQAKKRAREEEEEDDDSDSSSDSSSGSSDSSSDSDSEDEDDAEEGGGKTKSPARKRARTTRGAKKTSTPRRKGRGKAQSPRSRRATPKKAGRRSGKTSPSVRAAKKKELKPIELIERAMKAYKWWEEDPKPEGIHWAHHLEHAGISFPPAYRPHGVKMLYDGKPVDLTPQQEEVATMFASMPEDSIQLRNPETARIFTENFFKDFRQVLGPDHVIQDFEKCDFEPIRKHVEAERQERKARGKEEKEAEKMEKQEIQRRFGFALVDGHVQKVGNIQVEPPGLFRGRGKHPRAGHVKKRIMPEQISLNLSEDAAVPPCPIPGHQWGRIIHDPTVTWLCFWRENIMGATKYMYLSASSEFKGKSDRDKYEKARELKNYIDAIREHYDKQLDSPDRQLKQIGTAMWVIDRLALRVGGEKDEDEADTVGCCSLRVEHLTFGPPRQEQLNQNEDDVDAEINVWLASHGDEEEAEEARVAREGGEDAHSASEFLITLDFLGKDSMRYFQTIDFSRYGEQGRRVYRNFRAFCHGKKPDEDVLDQLTPGILNKELQELMPGLSAKVFRTYNASITLERQLTDVEENLSSAQKLLEYNRANRDVAILCNHQRSLPANFKEQFHKLIQREKMLERQLEEMRRWVKMCEKGNEDDIPLKDTEAPHHAKKRPELSEEEKQLRDEEGHLFARTPSLDQVQNRIQTYEQRLARHRLTMKNKDENKMVSLTTSKINYMDPRITVAWCKRVECPIERIFPKTLCDKFPWAMDVPTTFRF